MVGINVEINNESAVLIDDLVQAIMPAFQTQIVKNIISRLTSAIKLLMLRKI